MGDGTNDHNMFGINLALGEHVKKGVILILMPLNFRCAPPDAAKYHWLFGGETPHTNSLTHDLQ